MTGSLRNTRATALRSRQRPELRGQAGALKGAKWQQSLICTAKAGWQLEWQFAAPVRAADLPAGEEAA